MPREQTNGMKKHIQVHHPDGYQRFLALAKATKTDEVPAEGSNSAGTRANPLELFSDDEVSTAPRQRRRIVLEESDTDEDELPQVQPALQARRSAIRSESLESFSEGPAALGNGEYLVERVEAMRFSGRDVLFFVKRSAGNHMLIW
ncbi:hypothetical protein AAVH_08733 [Aphelenchoides avenae]|nr:hypothetical protein AAVH_08733 [Aphelenchus avenae]